MNRRCPEVTNTASKWYRKRSRGGGGGAAGTAEGEKKHLSSIAVLSSLCVKRGWQGSHRQSVVSYDPQVQRPLLGRQAEFRIASPRALLLGWPAPRGAPAGTAHVLVLVLGGGGGQSGSKRSSWATRLYSACGGGGGRVGGRSSWAPLRPVPAEREEAPHWTEERKRGVRCLV